MDIVKGINEEVITSKFWTRLDIPDKPPHATITLIDKANDNLRTYHYMVGNNKAKSVGSIQTLADMHGLMRKSLEILQPCTFFSPDFPDFLLPRTDHRYCQPTPEQIAQFMPQCSDNNGPEGSSKRVVERAITWGVVRKEPGTAGGPPFSGTQELRARPREFVAVFDNNIKKYVGSASPNFLEKYGRLAKFVKVYGQVFDNLVQYNIWTRSNYDAEVLTEWFENYMDDFRGMFREAGINQMHFDRRVRDDTLMQRNNGYHLRSILYYIRTERIKIQTILPIRRIDLNIWNDDLQSQLAAVDENKLLVGDIHNKIIDRWIDKMNAIEEINDGS